MSLPDNIANPSNISEQITRILQARDNIRTKLSQGPVSGWGISEASGANITALASIIEGITINDNIDVDLMEGDTYNIPKGYHTGAGVVKGVAGGGNYQLQAKTVSAGRSDITVIPDQGKYGLSSVKVNAIPSSLQDVSYVTAVASDVLSGKNIVTSDGTVTAGTMVNNGTVTQTLSTSATSYTIPKGYHSGSGTVSITTETKTVTPSATSQNVIPTNGKVLSKVTVNAMPAGAFSGADNPSISPLIQVTSGGKINVTSNSYLELHPVTTNGYLTTSDTYFPLVTITSSLQLSTQGVATITPTKSEQTAVASGKYTTGIVKVAAIPSAYQDVTGVTAAASQVLAGASYVTSDGTLTTGTMTNRGAVSKTLDATSGNQTYTIQSGYHNGSGSVSITLETKSATPSTVSQNITPTNGKVLSKVTVAAIPSAYQNVTNVTATAADVVASKVFVDSSGNEVTGTMIDRGTITTQTLSTSTTSYTIPSGKHSGSGKVQIVLEEKSATPSTSAQNIVPTSGKVLSKVAIAAIPTAYRDVTGVTATASQVLTGAAYVTAAGVLTAGTMTNVGAQVSAIDGLTVASKAITQGYHDGTGYIYLTNDIETALASI